MRRLHLKEEILNRLSSRGTALLGSPADLIEGLSDDGDLHSALFDALCDLQLSRQEALAHFESITTHQETLSQQLGRPVDLRVALLDLWSFQGGPLRGTKLIDVEHYLNNLRLAYLDGLTGLYNRRYLEEFLDREITRSERHEMEFSVLFMDIDDFKRINDSKGHAVGDEVLQAIGTALKDGVRREDLVARYGGEEFVLVMPQTDTGGASIFAERLLTGIRELTHGDGFRVTMSGGIATFPIHGTDAAELLVNADKGLYEAKLAGKNRFRVSRLDQRRHPRFRCNLDLLYSFDGTSYNAGVTRDVSRTGLCFVTDKNVEVGQTLSLLIRSRHQERTFLVETRIMWADECEDPEATQGVCLGAKYDESGNGTVEDLLHEAFGAGVKR